MGLYFADKFGYDYIQRLPPQTQLFYNQNAAILKDKYMENLKWSIVNPDDIYTPEDLRVEDIIFVDNQSLFVEMLDYFEKNKPDIIGTK